MNFKYSTTLSATFLAVELYTLFLVEIYANVTAMNHDKEKAKKTVLALKDRFGKNSMLRAIDLEEGATAIERNKLIGGHNE